MKLCINCDDFGLDPDIDSGVIELIKKDIVSSCSVLPLQSSKPNLDKLDQFTNISVGLHFSLTSGVNRFMQQFSSPLSLFRSYLCGALDPDIVYRELEFQYKTLKESISHDIIHIDCHEHIHVLPPIYNAIASLSELFKIPYIRIPRDTSPGFSIKKSVLNMAFLGKKEVVPFFGINLMGKKFNRNNIEKQFAYLHSKNITSAVWMVHAGYKNGSIDNTYNEYAYRENELSVLIEVFPYLQEHAEIVPLHDLL